MAHYNSLAELIREKMKEKNLSTLGIARNSGNEVSASTITKILNGEVRSNSVRTLNAIARGLGISETLVIQAVTNQEFAPANEKNKRVEELETKALIQLFESLPIERRDDVLRILEAFAAPYRQQKSVVVLENGAGEEN